MNIYNIILDTIGLVGGIGVVVTGLSGWLGKVWADRIMQKEIAEHKNELEKIKKMYTKEIEKYKIDLEISKSKLHRYNKFQFRIYNNLWKELYKMKSLSDDLWANANNQNLLKFTSQLNKVKEKIHMNALLIEENNYKKLISIIDKFNNYKIGKGKLVDLKNETRTDNLNTIDNQEIEDLVSNNKYIYDNFRDLLKKIYKNMKEQIS